MPSESEIRARVSSLLTEYVPAAAIESAPTNIIEALIARVAMFVGEDLQSYVGRDPATGGDAEYVFHSYSCFQVVLMYRLAHALHSAMTDVPQEYAKGFRIGARRISESAKNEFGIEIHPGAKIGRKFVLDHGFGTVIGETAVIADGCTLLNGIVLGAGGVAGNRPGRRHPTLGHGVQVAGNASILGAVTIGDHAFIGARCVVTNDIPPKARVTIRQELQYTTVAGRSRHSIYGIVPDPSTRGRLKILGDQLSGARIHLVMIDADGRSAIASLFATVVLADDTELTINIWGAFGLGGGRPALCINFPDGEEIVVMKSSGLDRIWTSLITIAA